MQSSHQIRYEMPREIFAPLFSDLTDIIKAGVGNRIAGTFRQYHNNHRSLSDIAKAHRLKAGRVMTKLKRRWQGMAFFKQRTEQTAYKVTSEEPRKAIQLPCSNPAVPFYNPAGTISEPF